MKYIHRYIKKDNKNNKIENKTNEHVQTLKTQTKVDFLKIDVST